MRSLIMIWVFIIFLGIKSSVTAITFPSSTISAAPSLLPDSPMASPPAFSPETTPLFPTTGGPVLSPADSSLPTIPSNPSPPNPDSIGAAPSSVAFPPSGSLPASSALCFAPISRFQLLGLLAFFFM